MTEQIKTEVQINKTARRFEKLSKIALYFLVFLLPIFFLPWTANVLDFNKQALLLFLVFISLFCWLLRALIGGKIELNFSFFNLPVIIFLIILAISAFFSASPYASFWGWPLNVAPSFLTILGFIFLYFLLINNFQKGEILGPLLTFIISSFLAIIFGGLQLFGKFLLPFAFSQAASFNTIGTVNALGVFAAALLLLISSLILISRGLMKFLFIIIGLFGFCLLFLINFWAAWIILLVGAAVLLIFGITQREIFQANWLILPMILLVVSLFFGILKISIPGLPAVPFEVSPSQTASFNIATQTLKDHLPVSLLLGSGPSTFAFDYSKFKPSSINQTAFWGVRFASGASEVSDKLATSGILGLISFLGILGVFIFLAFKWLLKKTKSASGWILGLGIFASWVGLAIGVFLYPFNLSLGFLFWFLTASFIVLTEGKVKTWTLEPSSTAAIGTSFAFIFLLILGIGVLFLGGQRYIAEVRYLQGLTSFQKGDNQAAANFLLSAISHTGGSQDNYWRDLSQIYLFRINEELAKTDVVKEEMSKRVSVLISDAINSAASAANLVPKNVANWTTRGFTYYNVVSLITGAEEWAVKSYEEAAKLEPTSPFIYTELGRVYLAKADALAPAQKEEKETEFAKAREQFQKSIDLKSDYAPAHFQLAAIYIRENKIKEAINKMEEAKLAAPNDVGLAFQLGVLYYSNDQMAKAQGELERAVGLDANYSNARYYLGLTYDKKGKKDLAVEQFEKIKNLNPDNTEVSKILVNLRAGKAALEGIVPAQPPIEEKPPEQLKKKK